MTSLWERIHSLEGRTLRTDGGRATFEITSVDDGYVRIVPRSSGKPRTIQRREFEQVERAGLATASVTKEQIVSLEVAVATFNLSYLPAIVRAAVRQAST